MGSIEFSRRAFLGLGATAAVAATAGLAGCSPQANTADAGESKSTASADASSWKTPPAEVTDFAKEYDCDVVVCGHGFAGITACRELAEQGKKVILVEKQPEDTYAAVGNEAGTLNASILKERGVPEIDPVEFFQNWMTITGNYPNQELVMKYAQNSGANMDWYLSDLTDDDLATMTTAFFPPTEHQMDHLGAIKFWPSVCSFYGDCNQTKIHEYNRKAAQAAGAEFLFGTEALYVVKDGDKVAGLVAKNAEGNLKFTCKAVVIACGGFGGNPEMMADLIPDMAGALVGDEQLSSMSANDGRGVQMAHWAGAHLETCPIPGMNMKGLSVPGKMNCLPQAVWIDENGKRFCNEYYPTSEQRGLATIYRSRKTKFAVLDANFPQYRQYTIPQHAGFTATDENIASLQESLDKAYAIFKGTYEEPAAAEDDKGGMGPVTSIDFIADDTLEGLAKQMGLEGEAVTNFIETIENYNAYCEAGADQQFGRDAAVLFPVNEAPFYACTFDPELGETMVTCGGIITDGEQNALDENFEPIPGLYVSGNDCGRRFGYEYITPIPGVSLGFAITLGRECGKSVAAFLG
ncbi:FAD-dependent oxidoreductase [Eggerthella sinensis]|jgi:fumarate reductase flavoprotein subunit|uniref:FAD-binding dehydrogenase n=1 Tax=Eggerthella sinensis TaxID=242230 RepID=A0A3N0IUT1_9ACTN|nr:FAD-dependent oxidoreductase [Eggerthella sinensis]MCB7039277.1 FAD-dependent oxidoreductase [Eggerthella sinensis]RDB62583.1 FAD-binding dehydrogenase [Eggerthella sinensis]RNM40759.1 FAD-binding dehydrogenase [Eggerthella sinensis]